MSYEEGKPIVLSPGRAWESPGGFTEENDLVVAEVCEETDCLYIVKSDDYYQLDLHGEDLPGIWVDDSVVEPKYKYQNNHSSGYIA